MLVTFGLVGTTTVIVLLVIALIIFGPGKLPELGKALGKGINEFKSATNTDTKEKDDSVKEEIK